MTHLQLHVPLRGRDDSLLQITTTSLERKSPRQSERLNDDQIQHINRGFLLKESRHARRVQS